jgi:hypothetical protein
MKTALSVALLALSLISWPAIAADWSHQHIYATDPPTSLPPPYETAPLTSLGPPTLHVLPQPQPHLVKVPWSELVRRALGRGGHWMSGCYWANCTYALQWVGEDGMTRRLMQVEWFQWFAPNIVQRFGCEMRPDGAVLHCKDWMTSADSFWVLAWDGTYHYQP